MSHEASESASVLHAEATGHAGAFWPLGFAATA